MFCVIDSSNRADFSSVLEQIDRVRTPGALDGFCRGVADTIATCEFDDRTATEAVFLVEIAEQNNLIGGITLVNSARDSGVGAAFPELFASGHPIRDERVFELSRIFLAEEKIYRPFVERFGAIFGAALACALERGATHVSLICDMDILALLLSLEMTIVPLGLPVEYGKTLCVALLVEISHQSVAAVSQRTIALGEQAKKSFH